MIDLRSDTVTQPTDAMRRAMADAEVGDDVYGEDPTVNRLESMACDVLGKRAAMYVPSGTMGNQIAIAVHAGRGSEVICEARAHVIEYELASMAVISGCMPRPVVTDDGLLTAERVEQVLRPRTPGQTRAGVIVIENTHNLAGGAVTPLESIEGIGRLARRNDIPLHMDGARIFNAAIACGVPAPALARACDSVMFCLSKGLSAPVGSILTGSEEFIAEARRWRRRLGGAMRQAGILAAAGLVALETMRDRLVEDHQTARALARGLARVPDVVLDTPDLLTNIVYGKFGLPPGRNRVVVRDLKQRGILCNPVGPDRIRFVTHRGITMDDIETTLRAVAAVQGGEGAAS
ncbi:MAG: threonine aldolase family protein [Acidobacteriota bacterium]